MSSMGTFVDGLNTTLAAATGLTSVTFSSGKPPDTLPPASTAVGFTWVTDLQQDANNQLVEEVTARVRIYPIQAEQFDGLTPIDPTALYDAANYLQLALAPTAATPSSMWFIRVEGITFDHDNQFIEADVVGTTWNDQAVS